MKIRSRRSTARATRRAQRARKTRETASAQKTVRGISVRFGIRGWPEASGHDADGRLLLRRSGLEKALCVARNIYSPDP
jgi:hypothetical protein